MPKRDIITISHASLTNHRIVATPNEPFPDVTFHLATPSLPDLVHVDAIPGQPESLSPLTLLQAYGQIGAEHREYMQRYFAVGKQLETSQPNDARVLEALASDALQQRTPEEDAAAAGYLSRAIELGSTMAWDFEELGSHLLKEHKFPEAEACLRKGIERAPYDEKLYSLLAENYFATNRPREAAATLTQALRLFPQVDLLRAFLREVQESSSAGRASNRPRN
jgi:tetratricopeptide (TPR) repeat protein